MDRAVAAKTKEIRKGLFRRTTLYDRFVFGKVQKMLGGAVRTMVTGAAPVSDEVLEFVKCAMGCPVIEGKHFVLILTPDFNTKVFGHFAMS